MINKYVQARVAKIKSKKDFDKYIDGVKVSKADLETRTAVIAYCRSMHPHFAPIDRTPSKELLEDILAGQADISDIGD